MICSFVKIPFDPSSFSLLPSSPGVYVFVKNNVPLYIGKSINIRARIRSHKEASVLDPKENRIISESDFLWYKQTDSDFSSLILESELIAEYQPKYNVILKDDKSDLYFMITRDEKYPKIHLTRKPHIRIKKRFYFGPLPSVNSAQEMLRHIRKIIPFCTLKKVSKGRCFYESIGLCNPCPNTIEFRTEESKKKELRKKYLSQIKQVIALLQLKTNTITLHLKQEMNQASLEQNYESALKYRNALQRFDQLLRHTTFYDDYKQSPNLSEDRISSLNQLISNIYPTPLSQIHRIECYDISNLSFENATGSLVVSTDGIPTRAEYKRFRIKRAEVLDSKMMEEVFQRRFSHLNWKRPDLVVVDGGKPQVKMAYRALLKLSVKVPVMGIAKHPDRLVVGTPPFQTIRPARNNQGFHLIQAIRDESHRFAKKYHLLLRTKSFLPKK